MFSFNLYYGILLSILLFSKNNFNKKKIVLNLKKKNNFITGFFGEKNFIYTLCVFSLILKLIYHISNYTIYFLNYYSFAIGALNFGRHDGLFEHVSKELFKIKFYTL